MSVLDANGSVTEEIKTKNILIATGSEVTPFPGIDVTLFIASFSISYSVFLHVFILIMLFSDR